MKKSIIVRTSFPGFHRYRNAPDEVAFLRNYHRHVFHVEAKATIKKDRELEFFTVKGQLDSMLRAHFYGREFDLSCEQVAEFILQGFPEFYSVTVFEDNENGSTVER